MKIYAGNLSYDISESDLREQFQAFGEVTSVNIITDKFSGRSKGFGFVEMNSATEAQTAIAALNGKMLKDRAINVNEARPRSDDRGRSSSRGGFSKGERRSYYK